jgi:phosphoribosylanthranilate isomerase
MVRRVQAFPDGGKFHEGEGSGSSLQELDKKIVKDCTEMDNRRQLQIKVCGMRDPQNLEQVCALAPDYIGFIFYERSSRFVGNRPDRALFDIPGPEIKKVGVFVNEELLQVKKAIELYGLDVVQLHGGESEAYCRRLSGQPVELVKAVDPNRTFVDLERFTGLVDYFLFDSAGEGSGGTGRKFDWNLLEGLQLTTPFLLSGGIGPEDAALIRALSIQALMGVDVNSRFELSPALKDVESLEKFITEIRK